MRYVLGIDVGTGGTRAVAVDGAGAVIASATEDHQLFASPNTGWAEQDPHDWFRACCVAVRKVLSTVNADDVVCVALTGQMHGAVLLDAADRVLRPALIWCDQRSDAEAEGLTRKIGTTQLVEWTCNPALTNFTATKLLWVKAHEPQLWQRLRHLLLPKDYVRFHLTGEHAIDVAEASGTLLLDVARRRWSSEMMKAVGVDESVLPKLYESSEIAGAISAAGAEASGLRKGTPVVAGAGDQAAGAVGMGIVEPGAVSATIGTSGVVFAATDRPALDPKGRLHTFCHAVPGLWHVMGVTQAAGLSLRWFRDTLAGGTSYDELTSEAAQVPAGCDGVLWAPYLMGERTPHVDPHARAALVGLAANHGRGHLVRAIMEGVAFSLKDTFTIFQEMNVPVRSIRLGGGGARSALWRQIQAQTYGKKVETLHAEEGAAYGAALLAGVGSGMWQSVAEACAAVVRVSATIEPERAATGVMQEQYARYRKLYPALRQVFQD